MLKTNYTFSFLYYFSEFIYLLILFHISTLLLLVVCLVCDGGVFDLWDFACTQNNIQLLQQRWAQLVRIARSWHPHVDCVLRLVENDPRDVLCLREGITHYEQQSIEKYSFAVDVMIMRREIDCKGPASFVVRIFPCGLNSFLKNIVCPSIRKHRRLRYIMQRSEERKNS